MKTYRVKSLFIALGMLWLLCTACEQILFPPPYQNDPEGNFEAFWQEFDQLYGLFQVREVNWDEIYAEFRPQVDPQTTDEELYHILVTMLERLDDSHIGLIPIGTDLPQYIGGPLGRIDTIQDFELEVVQTHYLRQSQDTEYFMHYGWLEDSIGYLHIYGFSDGEKTFDQETAEVLEVLGDAKGIVVDIRGGYGGEDIGARTIASYFADRRRLFMTNRVKNGPEKDDFTEPNEWHVAPRGETPYTKPIVLLTNRQTLSAREVFQLAMMTFPHVTVMGDTTAGGFSNNILRELPNGWAYSMSIGDWRAADGTNYEGRGIPPQILIQNQREDLLLGKDQALEQAIRWLK